MNCAVKELEAPREILFKGIAASGGVAHGRIFVVPASTAEIPCYTVAEQDIPREIHRLENALLRTREQVREVQRQVQANMGADDAAIFDAHLLILEDQTLLDEATKVLRSSRINIEAAYQQAASRYIDALGKVEDDFLRERVSDMKDVTQRVLQTMTGASDGIDQMQFEVPTIIIAKDLSPSVTARMDQKRVLGFATETGSKTSHTALLARALKLPAVVGIERICDRLQTGDYVLIDGFGGQVILNPSKQTLFEYGQIVKERFSLEGILKGLTDQRAVTADGETIQLFANVEKAADAHGVLEVGADGIGLFRTEFLFIERDGFPTEEEQFEAYDHVARTMGDKPVVIRTMDLGGDKLITRLQRDEEMNPFLGSRAIRFCLQRPDVFKVQLRAILRASAHGNVRMMYPMISSAQEVDQANQLLEECKQELALEGVPFCRDLPVGVTVEIPSAALSADTLARHVQFFTIGTNDLIQYTLAVDRLNSRIAHLYEPSHPAIARLIHMVATTGKAQGLPVAVCGEMAGDLEMIPLLLGLGIREFSLAMPGIPALKYLISRLRLADTLEVGEFALKSESAAAILAKSGALGRKVAPNLYVHRKVGSKA